VEGVSDVGGRARDGRVIQHNIRATRLQRSVDRLVERGYVDRTWSLFMEERTAKPVRR
jgi:hypothetical protein